MERLATVNDHQLVEFLAATAHADPFERARLATEVIDRLTAEQAAWKALRDLAMLDIAKRTDVVHEEIAERIGVSRQRVGQLYDVAARRGRESAALVSSTKRAARRAARNLGVAPPADDPDA